MHFSLTLALFGSVAVTGQSYPVVDTAQSACYNDLGAVITCPNSGEAFFGQDAQHAGLQPRYIDNGNGTVSDDVTGLMWLKPPIYAVTFDEAVAGASSVTTDGHSDWRLPTLKELYSLTDLDGVTARRRCPHRQLRTAGADWIRYLL